MLYTQIFRIIKIEISVGLGTIILELGRLMTYHWNIALTNPVLKCNVVNHYTVVTITIVVATKTLKIKTTIAEAKASALFVLN